LQKIKPSESLSFENSWKWNAIGLSFLIKASNTTKKSLVVEHESFQFREAIEITAIF
jgi:hypothetical protein